MSKNFKGSLFLISAALVWGLAFVAQKNAAGSIGVFSYILCRSVVTCAVLIPLCLIRGRGLKRYAPMGPALRRGLVMGVLTFGAISLQQWGMEYTSASKSGFVTALYIVLVPLLGLFFGKKPGLKVWLAVAIALMGAALLSLDFSESLLPGPGEALTFGCALVFSLHILYVDHRAQHLDSTLMCAIQFGVCAVLGGVGAIFEGLTFSQISGNLTSILYVGAISGAVGYTFQLAGQKYAEPALASLLMCLESVFGALGGWLIGGEVLRPLEYLGCALLLAGCVVAQLPQRKKTC